MFNEMEEKKSNRPEKKALKVLIVDDDWLHLEELMMILQMEELDVFPNTSPAQTIKNFRDIYPDIVISEIKEPKDEFLDFIKWLRSNKDFGQNLILIYTSDPSIDQDTLKDMEIEYLFVKPFEVEKLIQAIHTKAN